MPLALTTSSPEARSPKPEASPWIDIRTAAERSRKNEGHLRRLCIEKWSKMLPPMAELENGRWKIRQDADKIFSRALTDARAAVQDDILQLTDSQRIELARKKQILDAWHAYCADCFNDHVNKSQATDLFLAHFPGDLAPAPSRSGIYNWERAYQSQGLKGLIDQRTIPEDSDDFREFYKAFDGLYLTERKPKARIIHTILSMQLANQCAIPSIKTVYRHIDGLDPLIIARLREGKTALNEATPCFERDYTTISANECWDSDNMRFDFFCRSTASVDGIPDVDRPWLTTWRDCRSRKIMGFEIYLGASNSKRILSAFRTAVLAHGVPQWIMIDNGKDYDARHLQGETKKERQARNRLAKKGINETPEETNLRESQGVFTLLGVKIHHVIKYNARAKGIERWHRTVHDSFDRFIPTYCGTDNTQKPEEIALKNAPTLQDVIAMFTDWVTLYNATHKHTGHGMGGKTPNEVFAETLQTKRTATPEILDLLLQDRSQPARVTRNGVDWDGRKYGRGSACLAGMQGKKVILRASTDDITHVVAWTIDGRRLGEVELVGRVHFLKATKEDFSKIARDRKQAKSRLKLHTSDRFKSTAPAMDQILKNLADQAKSDASKNPPPNPMSIKPIQTAFDGDLNPEQKPLKMAVGADCDPFGVPPSGGLSSAIDFLGHSESPSPRMKLSSLSLLQDE
jgi:putative transposase